MKKILPLLARAFEDQSIEEFYQHAKDLAKPQKPKTVKIRKKKSNGKVESDVSNVERK